MDIENNNEARKLNNQAENMSQSGGMAPPLDPARDFFLNRPLFGLIVKNAVPAVASMVFMALYQIVDGIMVGRSLGPEALASVNILFPIMSIYIGLAVLIGVGGNARVAVLLGAGETHTARRVFGLVNILGTVLGVGGSIITLATLPQILSILGTSGELGNLAGQYLVALTPFFTPMVVFYILEQSVRNDGRPNLAMFVMTVTALVNIGLDYLFLFPLSMGIGGAALATGLAHTLGVGILLGYFVLKTVRRRSGLRYGIPGGGLSTIRIIAVNGSSEMLNNLAAGLTTFLFNRIILSYVGAMGVAAFALVQYLLMVGMMVIYGMCTGTQPIFSYNHGAGLSHRVRGTLHLLMSASLLVGIAFFFILYWQAGPLAALFVPDHPEALALTLRATRIMSWSMLLMPVGIVASLLFTALELAGRSLVIAISRGLVFTIVGLAVFPLLWGEWGIWFTLVFAEGATAFVGVFLIQRWMKKYQETTAEPDSTASIQHADV